MVAINQSSGCPAGSAAIPSQGLSFERFLVRPSSAARTWRPYRRPGLAAAILGVIFAVGGTTVPAGAQVPSGSPPSATASAPVQLNTFSVTADLDAAREEIAPSLGAVSYTIGPNQIQTMGQGESSSFQQVLLQAPGVVQD